MKHLFIINPAAGKYDHTTEYATTVERIGKRHGLEYEIALSTEPGACERLARAARYAPSGCHVLNNDGSLLQSVETFLSLIRQKERQHA